MSDSAPTSTASKLALPTSWPLYVGLVCLVVAVWPLLWQGLSSWREDDVLRDVATRFFRDVAAGRQNAALALLSLDYRRKVNADWSSGKPHWTETDDVIVQVLSVERRGDTADVRVSVAKSGFSLKPIVRLRRFDDRNWFITEIKDADVDPRWLRREEREAEESGADLADQLAEKLHLPPVTEPAER